jgi:hypothetical protein
VTGGWDPSDPPVSWRRRFNSGYLVGPCNSYLEGPTLGFMARFARCGGGHVFLDLTHGRPHDLGSGTPSSFIAET